MGTHYRLIPLGTIPPADVSHTKTWLAEQGISWPRFDPDTGRYPALREVRDMLDELASEGFDAEYDCDGPAGRWSVLVSERTGPTGEPWVVLRAVDFTGDEDAGHEVYAEKGWPGLVRRIAERLTPACGPLLLVATDGEPTLLLPPADADADAAPGAGGEPGDELAGPDPPDCLLGGRTTTTTAGAFAFLESHQPLPADEEWTQDLLDDYRAVLDYFEHRPDPRCVLPLLLSFGDGTGCGLYRRAEGLIAAQPGPVVLAALDRALRSPQASVRIGALSVALSLSSDPSLIPHYHKSAFAPTAAERSLAAANIRRLPAAQDRPLLEAALAAEEDARVRAVLQHLLDRPPSPAYRGR